MTRSQKVEKLTSGSFSSSQRCHFGQVTGTQAFLEFRQELVGAHDGLHLINRHGDVGGGGGGGGGGCHMSVVEGRRMVIGQGAVGRCVRISFFFFVLVGVQGASRRHTVGRPTVVERDNSRRRLGSRRLRCCHGGDR